MAATELASFQVSFLAKVEGYLAEAEKVKRALLLIGKDTNIGKELTKLLSLFERMIDRVSKHMNQRFSSESLITRWKDNFNEMESALIRLGREFQKVNLGDLKLDALDIPTLHLITNLLELKNELNLILSLGLKEILKDSLEILDAFKLIKVSKNASTEDITASFERGLETAKNKLKETNDEIDRLTAKKAEIQNTLNVLQNNSLKNAPTASEYLKGFFNIDEAKKLSKLLSSWLTDVKSRLAEAGKSITNTDSLNKLAEELKNLIPTLTPDEIKERIETIVKIIKEGSGSLKLVYEAFSDIGIKSGTNSHWVAEKIAAAFNLDNFNVESFRNQLNNLFNELGDIGLTEDLKLNIITKMLGLSEKDIQAGGNKIISALELERKNIDTKIAKSLTEASRVDASLAKLQETKKTRELNVNTITAGLSVYLDRINKLEKENQDLIKRVEELQNKVDKALALKDVGSNKLGEHLKDTGEKGLLENAKAAQVYGQRLDEIKEKEKLVGKLEGVVQRWFSIYAAVRMVSNAIKSITSTIKELDKSITEIAIVTNMSLNDLWGQMDKYTALAREYATSISGVYQVSLLYYQQGLLTAEVMELTEATLKMARISGLDYAEATDYMTNAVRSFKMEMEDAEKVVDVYSAIAAKSATNVKELAIAMSKTASSAESVGSSFENTAAMMAVMIEATRESSLNIGSAMKSIISRYGELKENPAKLVDSEGEELSLNKVDTALQSVGITLHNVKGEFRDFDDVIEELAKSWNTIDINTQRYIATVMAGNRQQSRFLALVSNYDRYKELSETAANSENASLLQFLKTLDSVEAKTQQLQTSILSLYTSTGILDLYKGLLDFSNSIINNFTEMPKIFKLPIPALINFASMFISLAMTVKDVFSIITNILGHHKIELFKLLQESLNNYTTQENEKVNATKNANKIIEENERIHVANMKGIRSGLFDGGEYLYTKEGKEQADLAGALFRPVDPKALKYNFEAIIASSIGAILKTSKNSLVLKAGGLASAGGQALSFAGMAAMAAPVVPAAPAIAAAIGGVLGIILNFDSIVTTGKKKLENLTTIADDTRNESLKKLSESKSLQSQIDKLKELEQARYSSIEAELKYLEASDALASEHQELISYYDATGKAIIDLAAANTLLLESLELTADAVRDAAIAAHERNKEENKLNNNLEATQEYNSKDTTNWKYDDIIGNVRLTGINAADTYNKMVKTMPKDFSGIFNNSLIQDFVNIYLTNSFSEAIPKLKKLQPLIDNLIDENALTEADKAVYDVIVSRITDKSISKIAASLNKLSKTDKAGATGYILSLLKLEEYQDKFWDDIDDNNEILTSMLISMYNQYNGDYAGYMKDIPTNLEKALEQLKLAIEAIGGKDNFNELSLLRNQVGRNEFINIINKKYSDLDANIKEALISSFENIYNIDDFVNDISNLDNSSIGDTILRLFTKVFSPKQYENGVIRKFSSETAEKLTGDELKAVSALAKSVSESIKNNRLTEGQGLQYISAYLHVWDELESETSGLDETLKEALEKMLLTWDGTKEGLEGILESIKSNGLDENSLIYLAVSNLNTLVVLNLNTIFSDLNANVSKGIKDFDDAIKNLSKGVALDKVVEYAEKLDLDLNNFELDYSTGLYKYKELNDIQKGYFENIDKLLENANTELEKYLSEGAMFDKIFAVMELRDVGVEDLSDTLFANNSGLAKGQIIGIVNLYNDYVDSIEATGEAADSFDLWLKNHYLEQADFLSEARLNAEVRANLSAGNLTKFLELINFENGKYNLIIIDSISKFGEINIDDILSSAGVGNDPVLRGKLVELLKLYGVAVKESFGNVAKDTYSLAIDTINSGITLTVEVTEGNAKFLENITGINKLYAGLQVIVDWSKLKEDSEKYEEAVGFILENVPTKTAKEILNNLENAVNNLGKKKAFDTLVSSWDNISVESLPELEELLGSDIYEKLAIHYDEVTKSWVTTLSGLREIIAEDEDLDDKSKNKNLAAIDRELRETSVSTALLNIGQNYRNLSEDNIKALADSLNTSYDKIKKYFTYDEATGKYSISINQLLAAYEELKILGDAAAQEVIQLLIDGYLASLSNISNILTSGYTKITDMLNFAKEINYDGLLSELYEWNDSLKTYVLQSEGIELAAANAKRELDNITNEDDKLILEQLIEGTRLNLAANIDVMSYIEAVNSGNSAAIAREASKFNKAIEDYNSYCEGLEDDMHYIDDSLSDAIKTGGMAGVEAAKKIAAEAGLALSSDDIVTIYSSNLNNLLAAGELLGVTIGSIIDETTADILDRSGSATYKSLGEGKYVVTSLINLSAAYKTWYEDLKNNSEATIAQINSAYAQWKGAELGSAALEVLSNSTIDYSNLGNALLAIGKKTEEWITDAIERGIIQEIGGGLLEILDFDELAKELNLTDKTSRAYINTLKQYNDAAIASQNLVANNIKDEIAAVATAKKGDKVNIAELYSLLTEDTRNNLIDELHEADAFIKDGVLDLTQANVIQVLAILQKYITTENITDLDDIDLKNIFKSIDDTTNKYIDNIADMISHQSSGYSMSEMQALANELNKTIDELFDWDNELNAYTLSTNGILEVIRTNKENLAELAEGTVEYEKLLLLISSLARSFAENIDLTSFMDALESGDINEINRTKTAFEKAFNNYNTFYSEFFDTIGLTAQELENMAAAGGRSAVMAALIVAEMKGKNISAAEVEAAYRSLINKVNKAVELLTYSVGEIIDSNAFAILQGVSDFHASAIGNGLYVIESVGDLLEAHNALYAAMRDTNEATTRELNAEWAKILNLKSGGLTIEYLSQAAEMTYEAFGEALASVGIDAGTSDLSSIYKDLGNGNIEITDFDTFATLLGFSTKHTEAYIAAYKDFNNKKIEAENRQKQVILEELTSLSNAKLGEKLDLTTLYYKLADKIDPEIIDARLSNFGAAFTNGILDLTNAVDIPGIVESLKSLMQDIDSFTQEDFAYLADALDEFLKSITDSIRNGIKGTLSNVDKNNLLNALLGNYGISLKEIDFTKTEEGLKLSELAAIRVWNLLDKIDKVLARLVFKELSDSLKETNENYYSVSDVMNRISTLQEKINHADTKTSDARLKQYQEELAVAEEIAKVRATSKDESFDFMNGKLPDALENPLTYADNWGKAINILLKGSGDKKGFIDARDWYNIVNEMNNIAGIGENIKMYGVELDGSLEAASALILKGYSALKSIDGGKMQVDLSLLGVSFEEGAMDMKGSVTEGIHAMAQSLIDMLDGLIAVLETVVAMLEAFEGFDTGDNNVIDLEEIFPKFNTDGFDGTVSEDFKEAATKIIEKSKKNKDLEKALSLIKIDNKSLADLLKEAADTGKIAETNYEAFTSIMNSLYQMGLSGDYDENNIYESVKKIAELSGLGGEPFKIDLGTSTIFVNGKTTFRVDWEGEDFKTAIERYTQATGIPLTTEQAKKKVEEVLLLNPTEIVNMADFNLYAAFSPDITVRYDDDGVVSGWVVDGQTYNTQDAAKEALILKAEGAKLEKPITVDKETGEQKVVGKIGTDVEVEIIDKEKVYRYLGFTGNTLDEAIDAFIKANWDDRENGAITEELLAEERLKIKIKSLIEPELEIKPPEDFKLTQDNLQKFMDLLASGKTIDGATIKENFGIDTGVTGELSADQIKQLTELFGVEYKPTVLKLSAETSEIDTKLSEILFGEGPINRTINITFGNGTDESGLNTVNGIPNPLETELIINIKGKLGDVNVTGEPITVNAPGAKEADLTKGELVIKTLVKTTAGEHEVNGDPTNITTTGSFDKADFSEGQGRIATAVKTAAGDLTVSGPATTENVDGLQDKVDSDTGVTVDAVSDELNVDATAVGKDNTYAATPLVVDSETKPRVDAIANSFIVDLEKAIATPGFENQKDAVKYKGALKVLATALEWDIKDAEPKEGTEGKAETWVQKALKQIKDIIGEVLQTDGNGNYVYTLEQAIGVLYSIGEWTEKVDENGKKLAATGQTPPQPEWPEGWCDDDGNLLDVKLIILNYGITYKHDEKSDGEIPPSPQMENPPPQIITQEIIYLFVHKFKDEGEITKNINDELGNGQIISDLLSKNDEQVKKYTNYLDELFTFKKQGGEFDENRINNIAELKRLMELADITETENYLKYFGKNGAFNVGTEKGEYTVSINPEINLENTSETEQNLVKEGNAESELETTIEDTIASNSSTIQDLFETGSATATLNVDINPNGKLPGEEGDDGSGDKSGKKDNTRTPVGGRITTTGDNNSDDTTKRNASGKKSSSKEEFHLATIETDVEMSTEGLSEPLQDLISKGETQTTMTIQQFAELNGLIDRGLLASNNGMGSLLGEELQQFELAPIPQIDAAAEALRNFADTKAVSDPELSNTLRNLADLAYTICGVDAGLLERLYHILENLPGAANTFMNDANWLGLLSIIKQLSATNTGGEGGGLTLGIESEPDETLLKILALFEASGIKISLNTNTPNPVPEGGNGGNPPEGEKGGKKPPEEKPNETSNTSGLQGKPIIGPDGKPLLDANGNQVYSNVPENAVMAGPQIIDNGGYTPKPITTETRNREANNEEDLNKEIKADTLNAEVKGNTEFKAEGAVELETPPSAPEAPEAPAAPEAPETSTEAPEADTSGVELLETAMTDMSAYAASAVEPINGVGSGLLTISSSASNLGSEAATIANNVSEAGNAATTAAGKLDELTGAINRIPSHTTIGIDAHVDLEVTASITEEKKGDAPAKGNADVDIKMGETSLSQSDFTISKAKGTNLALPKGNATTLMGELGPELYVSNGRYLVVGLNGAEFVDLPKDAIVFNHKKTAQLLKNGHMSGRGRPFTNISNALSFAKGSLEGGPAMASAAAALAALKQLRAMWASMLNASAKDLGSQAGRGGGGGGGKDENGNYKQPTNVIKDIERWYNLERLIANLEKEITYQLKLLGKYETDRIANGEKIYDTYKKQLEALEGTVIRQRELSKLQRSWYDNKRKELELSSYGKIFTYDENGLQLYVGTGKPGSGLGLDILENLTRRNVNGLAIGHAKTAKSQLKYLLSLGFNLNDLIYNDDGTKVVKKVGKNLRLTKMEGDEDTDDEELYAKMMENFWNNLDGWKEELDSLYDGIQDTLNEIEENLKKLNEIINKLIDNDIDIRNKLRDAIINKEQETIDKLLELKDALEESTDRFIDGLNDALEKDRLRSEENKADLELTKLQRLLAILQRSGGSAAQIKLLQDLISQKQEDMYYDERQKLIDAILEASDKELERLDLLIELLTETLEYLKENGLLWNRVEDLINSGVDTASAFYQAYGIDKADHALASEKSLTDFIEAMQTSKAWHEDEEKKKEEAKIMENTIENHADYKEDNAALLSTMTDKEKTVARYNAEAAAKKAKKEYLKENPGDESGATNAAAKAYHESLFDSWKNNESSKETVKNFNKNYDTWISNRRLKDANDFTNKESFKAHENEFKDTMLENYYLNKKAHENDDNYTDDNAWEDAIKSAEEQILASANEIKDENTSGTTTGRANLYYLTDEVKKTFKEKGTKFAKNSTFSFDDAMTSKNGTKMLHISGIPSPQGWIKAGSIDKGSSIFTALNQSKEIDTAITEGGISESGVDRENLGNTKITVSGMDLDNMKAKNRFGGSTVGLKTGPYTMLNKNSDNKKIDYGVRITEAQGLSFDKNYKLKKTGSVTVDAILVDGEVKELANETSLTIGGNTNALRKQLNAQISGADSETYKILKYLTLYKEGGMAYATGPAWLDGTKTKPEAVLNAKQTEFLKHDLLGSQNDSFMSMVNELRELYNQSASNVSNISNNDIGTFIERIDVTFESGVIRDDYDMKRASNMFKNELLRIARKTTTVNVKRR